MFDQNGEALAFQAVQVRVLEERKIPGATDSFHFAKNAVGVEMKFIEFLAGRFRKHGRGLYKS
jgi:hypothetical protein